MQPSDDPRPDAPAAAPSSNEAARPTLSLPPTAEPDPEAPAARATLTLAPEVLPAEPTPATRLPDVPETRLPTTPPAGEGLPERVGRFVIQKRLGEGAFGIVYRAHDPQLDRAIALKVAKPGALKT